MVQQRPAAVATPGQAWSLTRRRGLLALAAAMLGALGAASAVGILLLPHGTAVGDNVFVNPPGVIDANNTPTVARNPRDGDNLVVAHRLDRPGFSAVVHSSSDGGRTWRPSALPLPPGLDRPYAPDVAFSPDGTLYVLYANLTGRGNVPEHLWLARSSDGGRSFFDPVSIATGLNFQARLAVGPDGTVHVTYLEADTVGTLAITGPARVVAIRSTDQGQTFSAPVQVSDPARQRVGAASPAVTSRGDVVVLYEDFKGDVRDFQNLEGPVWTEPFALVVARSTDGGQTFEPGIEVESGVVPTRRFLVFLPPFPSLAAGADGTLYVAWADGRHGDEDVFLRRSADGGQTWSAAVRINDNPIGDGTSQYLPTVATAPRDRVDVLFYDRRRDPRDVLTDAFLASAPGGTEPFTNTRVSSVSFDSRVGPSAGPPYLEPDFGSRLGLASWDDGAFAAWTDTRLGDAATGRQDIVGARVRIPGAGALVTRLLLVVVGLGGAVVVLLLLRRGQATRAGEEG